MSIHSVQMDRGQELTCGHPNPCRIAGIEACQVSGESFHSIGHGSAQLLALIDGLLPPSLAAADRNDVTSDRLTITPQRTPTALRATGNSLNS